MKTIQYLRLKTSSEFAAEIGFELDAPAKGFIDFLARHRSAKTNKEVVQHGAELYFTRESFIYALTTYIKKRNHASQITSHSLSA